jgi:nitrate reductase delta subunit
MQYCAAAARSQRLTDFAVAVAGRTLHELQELYTQTFDWNPDTTLDIGWHLFGENYDRGDFLVKLRDALRRYGVRESGELPDHLSHVLLLLDEMPPGERTAFAAEFLVPALSKIRDGVAKTESPFLPLVVGLAEQVAAIVPTPVTAGGAHD